MPIRGKKIAIRTRVPPVGRVISPKGELVIESPIIADKTVPSAVVGPAAEVAPIATIERNSTLKQMGVITH